MDRKCQGLSHYTEFQRYRELTNKGRADLRLAEELLGSQDKQEESRLISLLLRWKQAKFAGKFNLMKLYVIVAGAASLRIRPYQGSAQKT